MRDLVLTLASTAVTVGAVTWLITERTAADWRMGAIIVASVGAGAVVATWRRARRGF